MVPAFPNPYFQGSSFKAVERSEKIRHVWSPYQARRQGLFKSNKPSGRPVTSSDYYRKFYKCVPQETVLCQAIPAIQV